MATSSSIDFNLTRDNIISHALELIGRLGAGETADSNDVTYCSNALNLMVKSWQNQGLHLWTRTEATVYLTTGTAKYSLVSTSSGANASNTTAETTISSDEASGQTVISVTSSTGMTASDVVLIEQDDNTLHATTISSVDSSTQITIASATTEAAASGNQVYTFTTRLGRPLDILSIRLENKSNIERVLDKISHQEYFDITNKTTQSKPNQYYYDPQTGTGQLYIWPTPDAVSDRLRITYLRSIEDFDAAGNDPDFPQEWTEALAWGLASRIAIAFGVDANKRQEITLRAEQLLQMATEWDNEHSSAHVIPGSV